MSPFGTWPRRIDGAYGPLHKGKRGRAQGIACTAGDPRQTCCGYAGKIRVGARLTGSTTRARVNSDRHHGAASFRSVTPRRHLFEQVLKGVKSADPSLSRQSRSVGASR